MRSGRSTVPAGVSCLPDVPDRFPGGPMPTPSSCYREWPPAGRCQPRNEIAAAQGLDVDWRLGYLSQAEVDRALGEATIAIFPYRPELDQSGSLLRALGAGVPAIAYDVGGVAEPVRRFGAGRVVPPGDVDAFAAALSSVLRDAHLRDRLRAQAVRARERLRTWDQAGGEMAALLTVAATNG